jgi:glycosyltransferase involved in cell wall biosynthesis
MRIGIDARELCGHATGVGRYLAGLLREWSAPAAGGQHEFVLYTPSALSIPLDARRFNERVIIGPSGTMWEQMRLPRSLARDHLDVFFAPAYTAPLSIAVPSVLTIHDVSYMAHPEWFPLREGFRRRWLTQQSAARARAVVTVSQFSRREIIEHLQVPENRIHVVPQGIDRPPAEEARFSGGERLLFVGSILNRRHVPELIRAVRQLVRLRPGVTLDVVGDDRSFPAENLGSLVAHLELEAHVRWHRYVTDAQLRDLYGHARAFAFLSEYEGLGMTPLEALAFGVPPVLYDTAVARESCGGAALYVPVGDRPALVSALETALFNDAARTVLLAAAPAVLAKYEWPRAARETLAVIESARC